MRFVLSFLLFVGGTAVSAEDSLFLMPDGVSTRWASGENPGAEKGAGGQANNGAKGAAFYDIPAGKTAVLLDYHGAGTIRRMWCTLDERTHEMLRSLRIDMYWDGAETPAVSAPLGDFFGMVHGEMFTFENALFSSPEGRSFNMTIPMPFRTGAKVTITNESDHDLAKFFYDVNFTTTDKQDENALYFHATWHRQRWTELREDFELLPKVTGNGRYLGAHVGILENPKNTGWFGEGEVKMYLDGDDAFPTLVGTGTEDYIGTGWGQGVYTHRNQGCWVADTGRKVHAFYRYHLPDPVWFGKDIRVTLQQMGGDGKQRVMKAMEDGAEMVPVSVNYGENSEDTFEPLLAGDTPLDLASHDSPDNGWTNMYRRDDVCATAFFYLDRPENGLPALTPVAERTAFLPEAK